MWLYITAIVIILLIVASLSTSNSNTPFYCDKPDVPDDYHYYPMVGMRYHNLVRDDLGVHTCYAVPQEDNPYDPFAIAIYKAVDDKLVGYVPVGNEELHRILTYRGGMADAIYRIQRGENNFFAEVYIQFDYKVFREDGMFAPYLTRGVKQFKICVWGNLSGKHRCTLTTIENDESEYNYTVIGIDSDKNPFCSTDDNQLQLYDYVKSKGNNVPACFVADKNSNWGTLFVPLNYTEKNTLKKIEELMN